MDKFRNKTTGEIIEAVQVPVKEEFEADKDLEQRYAAICAWLVDQDHVVDIAFDHKIQVVSYQLSEWYANKWVDSQPGWWIYQSSRHGVLTVSGDENFFSHFEKVEEE